MLLNSAFGPGPEPKLSFLCPGGPTTSIFSESARKSCILGLETAVSLPKRPLGLGLPSAQLGRSPGLALAANGCPSPSAVGQAMETH